MLILFLTAIMITSVKPVNAEYNVVAMSDSSFISELSGYYCIYGEVQNIGDTAVQSVTITATYYDSNDNILTTDYGVSVLDVLLPNAKSAFGIILLNEADVEQIDHYTLNVTYTDFTYTIEQALNIKSHSSYISSSNRIHITGEITNNGNEASPWTQLFATFYDSNGEVVGNDMTVLEPHDIPAGTTQSFDMEYTDDEITPRVASYRLTAESSPNKYTVITEVTGTITTTPTATPSTSTEPTPTPTVPEFPITAALIALLVGTFCSMLLLKRKQNNNQSIN